MSRLLVVSFAIAGALATQAAAQEPVYLRIGGQPGQSNKYQTTIDVYMRGPMASTDSTVPSLRTTRHSTRTVNAVNGDTITFLDVVDSARMESPSMPQMAERMSGQAAAMLGQTVTTKMDARARLLSVEVTNPNATDASGAPAPGSPGGGGGGGMRMPGRNQRAMFVLPERAVRAGDTWTDSVVIAGAGPTEGPTNFLATYKLERVEQRGNFRVAVVSLAGNMVTNSPNGPQTMSVIGELAFDITGRRLVNMTMQMNGVMPTPRGDVPIKMLFTHALVS